MGRKGQKPGPGRPKREIEHKYHEWFKEAVTEEDFKQVVRAVLEEAKLGKSIWAAKFITEYLIGQPGQAIQIDQSTNHSGGIEITIKEEKQKLVSDDSE